MKKFTEQEIRIMLNQIYREELSFSRMVEVINKRISEAEDTPEELKKGDLAIFWDETKGYALIRFYERSDRSGGYLQHTDNIGSNWYNAIKFESEEQYKKLLKGEI